MVREDRRGVTTPRSGAYHWSSPSPRAHVESLNNVASNYNVALNETVGRLGASLPALKIAYFDVYNGLLDLIKNPAANGNSSSLLLCVFNFSIDFLQTECGTMRLCIIKCYAHCFCWFIYGVVTHFNVPLGAHYIYTYYACHVIIGHSKHLCSCWVPHLL